MFTIMRPAVRVWGVASSTPPSTRRSFYLARTLGSYNSIPSFPPTSTSLSSVGVRELSEKTRWLGQLNLNSRLYFEAHKVGVKHSSMVNNIITARPIHHQNMVDTLLHLCKKIPILRVNIKPRGGQPWYYEDEHINLDFQVNIKGD
ncbi:uncharacterized protein LOC121862266 [Homarus americanus]|uniref:uncharacterized protein LOC121862266 n=1 Tax=Homarus americanus TaxID=6706 RepID=UPI001C46910B|nr:uncharacterized protein LOC121862266 [Homarus americanus]